MAEYRKGDRYTTDDGREFEVVWSMLDWPYRTPAFRTLEGFEPTFVAVRVPAPTKEAE